MAAYPIKSAIDLGSLIREFDPDVVGVDEAQFFDDAIGRVLDVVRTISAGRLATSGSRAASKCMSAGLDLDAWARPFGPMPNILAFADRVEKFTAELLPVRPGCPVDPEDRGIQRAASRSALTSLYGSALRRLLDALRIGERRD